MLTKVVIVGAVVAGLLLLPVIEEIALLGVVALAAGIVMALLAASTLGRLARRYPLLGVLIGAWLLHRHERRRRAIDARSWTARSPYPSPRAPPDPRTRSPW
jgi:hypothetical protein